MNANIFHGFIPFMILVLCIGNFIQGKWWYLNACLLHISAIDFNRGWQVCPSVCVTMLAAISIVFTQLFAFNPQFCAVLFSPLCITKLPMGTWIICIAYINYLFYCLIWQYESWSLQQYCVSKWPTGR